MSAALELFWTVQVVLIMLGSAAEGTPITGSCGL